MKLLNKVLIAPVVTILLMLTLAALSYMSMHSQERALQQLFDVGAIARPQVGAFWRIQPVPHHVLYVDSRDCCHAPILESGRMA